MSHELTEIEDDFSNLCNPNTIARLQDLIGFYSQPQNYDEEVLTRFRSMLREGEKQCGVIVRSMHDYPNHKSEKRFTMRGFDVYEINENGSLSIPEPISEPKTPNSPTSQEEILFKTRNQTRIKKR